MIKEWRKGTKILGLSAIVGSDRFPEIGTGKDVLLFNP